MGDFAPVPRKENRNAASNIAYRNKGARIIIYDHSKRYTMLKTIIHNSDLHFEHNHWNSELRFWQDELMTFAHRLEELVARYTDPTFLKKLEHYQNEIHLHENRILECLEAIERHEARIAGQSKTGPAEVMDIAMVRDHMNTREKMEMEREVYLGFKKEFFRFLTEYM